MEGQEGQYRADKLSELHCTKSPTCLHPAAVGSLFDDAELRVRNEMGRSLVENMTNDSKATSLKMAMSKSN